MTAATVCLLGLTLFTAFAYAADTPTLSPKWVAHLDGSAVCTPGHPGYDSYDLASDDVQHDSAGNIVVSANGLLRGYTRHGALRWSAPPCPGCATPEQHGMLRPFVVMPGGGVWALEARANGPNPGQASFAALHRLHANGAIVSTQSLTGTVFQRRETRLLATSQGAVLVVMADAALHVLRMRNGVAETSAMPFVSDRDRIRVTSAAAVGHDDILVETLASDDVLCSGLPLCNPFDHSLLRLSADNELLWRRDTVDPQSELSIGPDGTVYFIGRLADLVSVTSDGTVTHRTLLPDTEASSAYGIAGPIDGYLLIGSESLQSVDLAGAPGGRLDPDQNPYRYPWRPDLARSSRDGFVVPLSMDPQCHAAAVYAPATLTERYRLHVDGTTCVVTDDPDIQGPTTSDLVATTADGGVTLLRQECGPGSEATIIARFGFPGTPVGDLLMRDDFESLVP